VTAQTVSKVCAVMEVQGQNDQPIGVEWIRSSVRRRVVVAAWAVLATTPEDLDQIQEGAPNAEP